MFLFGLFSTHIPYLILLGLYFIGFGAYSYSNFKSKAEDNTVEKHITANTQKYNKEHKGLYHLNPVITKQQTNFIFPKNQISITCLPLIKRPPTEKFILSEKRCISSHFCRPPPVC